MRDAVATRSHGVLKSTMVKIDIGWDIFKVYTRNPSLDKSFRPLRDTVSWPMIPVSHASAPSSSVPIDKVILIVSSLTDRPMDRIAFLRTLLGQRHLPLLGMV
jgi:hypothetical protein